jgi:hypothetical protein
MYLNKNIHRNAQVCSYYYKIMQQPSNYHKISSKSDVNYYFKIIIVQPSNCHKISSKSNLTTHLKFKTNTHSHFYFSRRTAPNYQHNTLSFRSLFSYYVDRQHCCFCSYQLDTSSRLFMFSHSSIHSFYLLSKGK